MMQELGAFLSGPWFDRGLAVVLVFVLLKYMHDDISANTRAIIDLRAEVQSSVAHNTSRMEEIRQTLMRFAELIGALASKIRG